MSETLHVVDAASDEKVLSTEDLLALVRAESAARQAVMAQRILELEWEKAVAHHNTQMGMTRANTQECAARHQAVVSRIERHYDVSLQEVTYDDETGKLIRG